MKNELPKAYEPAQYEDQIYQRWEQSGFFNPDTLNVPSDAPTYTIVLPPPNITDKLHLGHSAMLAIEDLLIRAHRMQGFRTLWIPGTDHAAIATQNVVEKKLLKETGQTRHQFGKDPFLAEVWKFLNETQATIQNQIRKMGGSLDWSREAFTFDEQRKKAVTEMFIQMFEAGIIYRGERIVNWCPRCHSTLADDEVEYESQKTTLYYFKYDRHFPLTIATTRPETKLGDTAVAVNPKDERYAELIGKTFQADFCGVPLSVTIIADRNVEQSFGTGALGVTPAHSMVDWNMAETHHLPVMKVIDEDGHIHPGFGSYSKQSALDARTAIVACLREKGLIEREEEIENNLSICYRCGTAVEPLPSKQWFVAVDKPIERLANLSLKQKALEVAQTQEIQFVPARFTKRYTDWMSNLHDWCISRQIWFGHPIPAWICDACNEVAVSRTPVTSCPRCTSTSIRQDEDTLDTWFSSGMWTFSTLGWPETFQNGEKSGDLARFHPTQVLETGYEIITLWVSRMIMMSLFAVGEIPFSHVYLHGLVLDKFGKKMSKSKGNGIDPLDMIPKYGTDAVRLSLLIGSTPGNDMRMFEEKIEGFRNFINKLWNISRYIEQQPASDIPIDTLPENLSLADQWILNQLNELIQQVTADIDSYQFSAAGERLRDFTWSAFADWYLEISKIETNKTPVLRHVLKTLLALWHPMIPFVTEQIYAGLFAQDDQDLLMVAPWPKPISLNIDPVVSEAMSLLQAQISAVRRIRARYRIKPDQFIPAIMVIPDHALRETLSGQIPIIDRMARVTVKDIFEASQTPHGSIAIPSGSITTHLALKDMVDVALEKKRLTDEISQAKEYLSRIESKLDNQQFLAHAPSEVIQEEQKKQTEQQKIIAELHEYLTQLG